MIYEELAPSPSFAPFIERFWAFSLEAHDPSSLDHVIVPDGTTTLSVTPAAKGGRTVTLAGPSLTARRLIVEKDARYQGLRFRAGGVRACLGIDMAALVEKRLLLAEVAPDLAGAVAVMDMAGGLAGFARAFEILVASWATQTERLDRAVCGLADALIASDGAVVLQEIMDGFGVGSRQLRRRFVAETGLTPKAFSRLRRVRRACVDLVYLQRGQVAAVSADHGFADQPHFTREMKAVFGMSPQLVHAYLAQIQHRNLLETAGDVRFLQAEAHPA